MNRMLGSLAAVALAAVVLSAWSCTSEEGGEDDFTCRNFLKCTDGSWAELCLERPLDGPSDVVDCYLVFDGDRYDCNGCMMDSVDCPDQVTTACLTGK